MGRIDVQRLTIGVAAVILVAGKEKYATLEARGGVIAVLLLPSNDMTEGVGRPRIGRVAILLGAAGLEVEF